VNDLTIAPLGDTAPIRDIGLLGSAIVRPQPSVNSIAERLHELARAS
jgi:hypothetical protein